MGRRNRKEPTLEELEAADDLAAMLYRDAQRERAKDALQLVEVLIEYSDDLAVRADLEEISSRMHAVVYGGGAD